jgi:hypothetical protein
MSEEVKYMDDTGLTGSATRKPRLVGGDKARNKDGWISGGLQVASTGHPYEQEGEDIRVFKNLSL